MGSSFLTWAGIGRLTGLHHIQTGLRDGCGATRSKERYVPLPPTCPGIQWDSVLNLHRPFLGEYLKPQILFKADIHLAIQVATRVDKL